MTEATDSGRRKGKSREKVGSHASLFVLKLA
jgi:hypothetical protein